MARPRKKHAANHERWLVSYADLLTLLFAFFVVLFSSTQSDHARAKEISEAVDKAFRGSGIPPRLAEMLGGAPASESRRASASRPKTEQSPKTQPPLDLAASLAALNANLSGEIDRGAIRIHLEERGIVIGLNAQVLFPSGDDAVDVQIYPTIAKVADVLKLIPNSIRLEGHTDSRPIYNARFRSNWELSAARGIAMLRLFHDRYHIASDRMAIIGYGETNAISGNETEAGRTRNRRVDIVIVSDFGMRAEPGRELPPAR